MQSNKPDMGNSRLNLNAEVKLDDHLSASMYLNIEDQELVKALEKYFTLNGGPSITISKRDDSGFTKITTCKLFMNERPTKSRPSQTTDSSFGDFDE